MMGSHRIQKLLFNEYRELGDEMVLIESPFAQTTRDGKGIRQVHLGLTPSKLIVASDILTPAEISNIYFPKDADPEIESFELLSVFPIQCLTLSIFRRKRRRVLKARFCNDRVLYFELGGNKTRRMLWTLWLERVRFMDPSGPNSRSESSIISSTSGSSSTMYLAKSRMSVNGSRARVLQLFESTTSNTNNDAEWRLYRPALSSLIIANSDRSAENEENQIMTSEYQAKQNLTNLIYTQIEPKLFKWMEDGVSIWVRNSSKRVRRKHPRRWGISPLPLFLHGFGPWRLTSGTKTLTQLKSSLSCVCIARLPNDPELQLPVSKRQLSITISCTDLSISNRKQNKFSERIQFSEEEDPITFWTPDYWYRPRNDRNSYHQCRYQIQNVCYFLESKNQKIARLKTNKKKPINETLLEKQSPLDSIRKLRESLRLHTKVSAWDIDTAALAHTLNCIDSTLCSRISPEEACLLPRRRPVPGLLALVAFSHRVACLVATEILREQDVRLRARLIARFINVAEKCAQVGNFQSCQSILAGLQSPAIFRLEKTWSHLRRHHSSRYHSLELLCRRHRNPSTELFLAAWTETAQYRIRVPSLNQLVSSILNITTSGKRYQSQAKRSLDSIYEIRKNIPPQLLCSNKKDFILKSNLKKSNLETHNLAFEFLFKARYREEMANFYRSFLLEPNNVAKLSENI